MNEWQQRIFMAIATQRSRYKFFEPNTLQPFIEQWNDAL
jgi:hypothetical protein